VSFWDISFSAWKSNGVGDVVRAGSMAVVGANFLGGKGFGCRVVVVLVEGEWAFGTVICRLLHTNLARTSGEGLSSHV
jgi:hypothetical protein